MGTQFLNADVGRRSTNLTNKLKSTMFRFVALFALVAVAFAEPEADSQFLYSNVAGVPVVNGVYNTYAGHVVAPVVKPVVPVVKAAVPAVPVVRYMNPHHTEGMTKQGVPEKTDSVKVAEKQHELAKEIEKVTKVQYVAPYTTYAHAGFPYVHHPVAAHVIAKREADSDAPQLSSTTPTDLYTHTLPPTLDTHTQLLLLDTHTPLDIPTTPSHTEMFTDGIEPLRRTYRHKNKKIIFFNQ